MSLFTALSSLVLAAVTPVAGQCEPIPGWDQVLADERSRIIVIGEVHGSNEVPATFANIVCLTAASRPVVVALEQPSMDQGAIDSFMASDGGVEARRAFLRAQMWNGPMKDGRSSQAYFRLFDELRRMHAAGTIESVIAFQPSSFTERPTPEQYERAMADLVKASSQPGTTVVALVGNVHAMLAPVPWEPRYTPMAGHLPADEVVTLNVVGGGGEAWSCRAGPDTCGPRPSGSPPNAPPRGVVLDGLGASPYSGVLYLGGPTTASSPQPAIPAEG